MLKYSLYVTSVLGTKKKKKIHYMGMSLCMYLSSLINHFFFFLRPMQKFVELDFRKNKDGRYIIILALEMGFLPYLSLNSKTITLRFNKVRVCLNTAYLVKMGFYPFHAKNKKKKAFCLIS